VLLLDRRPFRLLRLVAERLRKRGEVLRETSAHGIRLVGCLQLLERVLVDRLQHRETDAAVASEVLVEQALGHEGGQLAVLRVADCGRVGRRAAAREHGEAGEQRLLARCQQLVAPVDRRTESALAGGQIPGSLARELEASREKVEQLGGGVRACLRGGELDRERKAVEPAAELHDLVRLLARPPEARCDGARPRGEQLDRVAGWERPDAVFVLAREVERRPARGEDGQLGGCGEQRAEQRCRLVHVLEVVHEQEEPAHSQVSCDRLGNRLVATLLDPQRVRDRGRDQRRVAKRREVGEVDAVGELAGEVVRDLQGEARLAAAPRPRQRHEAHVAPTDELQDLLALDPSADERCLRCGQMPSCPQLRRLDPERRVLPEDRLLERLQLRPRLDAELVSQRGAEAAEGGERVDLTAAPVERQHELPVQALAKRVVPDERLELREQLDVTGEREIGLDPLLDGDEAKLLDPGDVALGKGLVGDVGQGRASPEPERFAEDRGRLLRCPGREPAAPLREELLESLEVELALRDPKAVSGPLGRDAARPQPLSERVHLHLERVPSGLPGLLAPERVDEEIARDDLVRVQQQVGEQQRLPSGSERDGAAVVDDLERSQNAEVRGPSLPRVKSMSA
jgi:hypothetical protein